MNWKKVLKIKEMKSKSYLPYNSKLIYQNIDIDYERNIKNTLEIWQSNTDKNSFYTIEYEENLSERKTNEKNIKNRINESTL